MSAAIIVLASLAAAPISVDYRGTLGQALSEIATKGNVNLIATGDLNVPAEVHLRDVTAEEALEALVKVHGLDLHHEGKLWIVKPTGAATAAPLPPPPPPVPAVPEKLEADADAHEQKAEELRDQAEAAREKSDEEAEARREQVELAREKALHAGKRDKWEKKRGGKQLLAAGPISVPDGDVVDDVVSYGGSITLGDGVTANGDVVAFGGDVLLGDGTTVEGDAVSFGGQVKKGDGSVVHGEEVSFGGGVKPLAKALPSVKAVETNEEKKGGGIAAFLVFFATFFGLGFLLMMFAPNRMKNIEAEIRAQPVKSGLAGLLAGIGWLPLTALLCLTLVGIPVAFVMWLVGPMALAMGMLALANTVGSKFPIARLRRTQAMVLAVGVLTMMLAFAVPVLGVIVMLGAMCVSFGAIIRTRAGQRARGLPMPDDTFREVGA
jgi:hypothetical protein